MPDSSLEFMSMASRASSAFLQGGVPLNDAIAKIAGERDLSRVQIQRVVELANHETNEQLMKKAEDKTFRFDVASVDGVLAKLGVSPKSDSPEMPKVAGFQVRAAMKSYIDRSGDKEFVTKTASATLDHNSLKQLRVKHAYDNCIKIASYIANERRDIMVKRAGLAVEIREAMQDLTQFAKNNIANGRSIGELHKFACCYDRENGPMWDVVFKSVKNGIVKVAKAADGRTDATVAPLAKREPDPDHRKVMYEVVTGNQNLAIGLDTLKNKISEEDRLSKRLRLMDTLGPAVVCCVKQLKTSDDVSDHITKDIEKAASVIQSNISKDTIDDQLSKLAVSMGTALKVGIPLGLAAGIGYSLINVPKRAGETITEGMRPYQPGANVGVAGGRPIV